MLGIRRALFGRSRPRLSLNSHELRCLLNFRGFSRRPEHGSIDDFNQDMEMVFGRTPEGPEWGGVVATDNLMAGVCTHRSNYDDDTSCEWSLIEGGLSGLNILTHVDDSGKASMVNVVDKTVSKRVAVASGRVILGPTAFQLVAENNIAKGDVLTVAKIAGISGAKQTGNLIPLCHNILLSGVDVSLSLNERQHAVEIRAEATATGPTGVEMEALTAVSIASLTVYDMCKAVSKNIEISKVQLESKTGGKSGDWSRE